jgi:hypothetical protein
MKCNKKEVILLADNLLADSKKGVVIKHLEGCVNCKKDFKDYKAVSSAMSSYTSHKMDNKFKTELINIQYQEKKKISILHLFPKEFALTAASILLALFIGGLFSNITINQKNNNLALQQDYIEQTSLVTLVEY